MRRRDDRREKVFWPCYIFAAVICAALCLAGCGQGAEQPPAATAAPEYYDAGRSAADRGDYAAAVDAFSQAIEAGDSRAAAYAGRADCYLAMAEDVSGEGPDLKGLALRDYEIALALDPGQSGHIYEVYEALAEQALAADGTDEALSYLRTALAAASKEKAQDVLARVKGLTDGILTASVWYMDAPDSRYYAFDGDGAGRIVDPIAMETAGTFHYENEGFVLRIREDDAGKSTDWTYDPDRESYFVDVASASAEGGALRLRLEEAPARRMYGAWQASILAAEADGQLNWTDDAAAADGYGVLYEKAYGLLDALAGTADGLSEEEAAALEAVQADHAAPQEEGTGPRERYERVKALCAALLDRVPAEADEPDTILDEVFPVGESVLLNYFRHLINWTLDSAGLSVSPAADEMGQWQTLEDVDHYFADGRLYLCLPDCALQGTAGSDSAFLGDSDQGRFVIKTPLTLEADVNMEAEELPGYLAEQDWISLMDLGGSTEVFALALDFGTDMTCSARGGYFPEELTGRQSGRYALDGRKVTITMSAAGYTTGTYVYELVPMGESLYMTLLSDGIVYGQTAGSTYVFCGTNYAAEAAGFPEAELGEDAG